MKKIRLKKPLATVTHPNDPDVKVTLERPTRSEMLHFQAEMGKYDRFQPAIDPSGRPILDDEGRVRAMQLPAAVPVSMMQDFFVGTVRNIVGLLDESGHPVPFSKETARDMIAQLVEQDFDVTETRTVSKLDTDGKPIRAKFGGGFETVEAEVVVSFYQYLLSRLSLKETFQDPSEEATETPSPTPANAN